MAIETYNPNLASGIVDLFNREGGFSPFIAHLTPRLFERRVTAKGYFDPEGIFVETHGGRLTGAIFTTFKPSDDKSRLDYTTGVIDGFFFSDRRPACGDRLVDAALGYLKGRGAARVIGWATEGEYPFWRDLYCGSEPVMHVASHHVCEALLKKGFEKCQQSVAMLARTNNRAPEIKIAYTIRSRPADQQAFWPRNSWLDLWPLTLEAEVEGYTAGRLGWCALPATSRRRGVRTAGVYSLFVSEAYRRRGVASALLARCFEQARRDGAEEILLATGAENHAAIATYRKFGFVDVFEMTGTRLARL